MRNWAGNLTYSAAEVHEPATVAQVQAVVARSPQVRALGSRHSFNDVADTTGVHVSLARLAPVRALDTAARTVTIDGGVTYGTLAPWLHERGWALANLASLPHIGVAGACATGTHGSGAGNQGLAAAVRALQLVTAVGDVVDVDASSDPDAFAAMSVGLGAFGVVTGLTLAVEPTFDVRQRVVEDVAFDDVVDRFDEIMASGYSVSLFTTWGTDRVEQLWRKERTDAAPFDDTYGGRWADGPRHPIGGLDPTPCTEQLGAPGPWHERLPHFRLEHTPSSGDELQSELFVARADASAAIGVLRALGPSIARVLQISEIRIVAADEPWLSPACGRDVVAFHFTWDPTWEAVRPVLARIEDALAPFSPRPHWGKLTTLPGPTIRARVERWDDVAHQLGRWDPHGRFRNAHLTRLLA